MDEQMEEQLEQLKELMQKQEKLDEDQMREQEKQMKLQEEQLMKQMEEQEKLMRQQEEKMERQESRFDKANQALESELLEDGLIKPGERYSFKISNEGFFLNDKKQSDQLYQKYLDWLKDNDVFRYKEGTTLNINRVAE
jgi:tRNA/tmRNA/rRNA uracil-C5-methylase (TrmA/RlmC/RlmD family)